MNPIKPDVLAAALAPDAAVNAASIQAVTFTETVDAGNHLNDAIPVFSDQALPLTAISGTLSGDADLFQIVITGDRLVI